MKRLADGHRDPKTGQCTSISTQYRIKAIPAFVVDTPTQSVNEALDKTMSRMRIRNQHSRRGAF